MPAPPLWSQIADRIRAQIAAGELTPGDELPPQAEIAQAWESSLQPVKRAMLELERDGVIVVRPGRRPVVAEPPN